MTVAQHGTGTFPVPHGVLRDGPGEIGGGLYRSPSQPGETTDGEQVKQSRQLPGHWQDFVCAQFSSIGMTFYH